MALESLWIFHNSYGIHTEFFMNSAVVCSLHNCGSLFPFVAHFLFGVFELFHIGIFSVQQIATEFFKNSSWNSAHKSSWLCHLIKNLVNLQCILFLACQCNMDGSEDGNCATDGQCSCKENIAGAKCDQCQEGYSMNGFPTCQVIMPNFCRLGSIFLQRSHCWS